MNPVRLDVALVQRGLARSRTRAAELIAEGGVIVNGQRTRKSSVMITDDDLVEATDDRYVSRAAHKLVGALDDSQTSVTGRVLDAGASTGGFTQVLLERGATRVYAVDVGHGQIAAEVADDPRVVVREGLNLRDLSLADLGGELVDLVVADVSFISLRMLVEPLLTVVGTGGVALLMVKPQFEVGRDRLGKGGVVKDEGVRTAAVDQVAADALALGWQEDWRGVSRLPGPAGNVEIFLRLRDSRTVGSRR